MHNEPITQREETVFTLNNTGLHNLYMSTAFSVFEIFLSHPESKVHEFMKEIDFFKREDFMLLHFRISIEKVEEVRMRMKHIVIMYAVIHYVCKSLVEEEEEHILVEALGDSVKFNEVRNKILIFGRVSTDMFKKHFVDSEKFNAAVEIIVQQ